MKSGARSARIRLYRQFNAFRDIRLMTDSSQQSVFFEGLFDKPLTVKFSGVAQSSDSGLVLLKSVDDSLKLTSQLGACLSDERSPLKVRHSYLDCFRQRVFSIAGGYEDGNDAARMRHDPALLMSCGRDPFDPEGLASQATISRMENAVTAREVIQQGRALERIGVEMLKKRLRDNRKLKKIRVVIDLDPSVDPTHGAQQGSLFHAFYRSWCYLPMFGFLSFEGEPDHVPFAARLRPGNSKEPRGTIALLRRIVAEIRSLFGSRKAILVRLDAGFAHPRVLDALEELKVKFVVGMPTNDRLKVWAKKKQPDVRKRAKKSGETERAFDEKPYKARSWKSNRRVILKAESIPYPGRDTKDNPRFVVTNLRSAPKKVYATYCMRGDAENRIKEVKRDLHVDRTSCSRFVANQLRVIMTTAAYMMHVELRWRLRRTKLKSAQVSRLITTLIKVSVVVKRSVRRYLFQLPANFPFAQEWQQAALSLGAVSG